MPINEENVKNACRDLTNGVYTTLSKAAREWGVSRDTVRARLHGRPCHRIAHENQQRLSNEQEALFVVWIYAMDHQGHAPIFQQVRSFGELLLRKNGDFLPLGQQWI